MTRQFNSDIVQRVRLPPSFTVGALSAALLLFATTMVLLRSITVNRGICVVGTITEQDMSTVAAAFDILVPSGAVGPPSPGTVLRLETSHERPLESRLEAVTATDEGQGVLRWQVSLGQPIPRSFLRAGRVDVVYESNATGLRVAAESLMRAFRPSGQSTARCS